MLFLPFHLLFQEKSIIQPIDFSNQFNSNTPEKKESTKRKTLFLKAKACERYHDWDQAVRHYTRLIIKYPFPVFSSLQAYGRLLDAYAVMNPDFKVSEKDKSFMMEILAAPARPDDQLLLAKEIYRCGFDEVFFATFSIGVTNARRWLSQNRDTYLSFKILWRIEWYAHEFNQYDLLEQSAGSILKLAEKLAHSPLEISRQQKIQKIKRQTCIWLAEIDHTRNQSRAEFSDI